MSPKKILALIPARSGSKSVRDKNILDLGGYPLLAWSIQAAKLTFEITDVVVSTDSSKYKDISEYFGAEVPFLRPANISEDNSSDLEFIRHTLEYFYRKDVQFDLLVHLRPTTPLRNPKVISNAITNFTKYSTKVTALRSVHETSESLYKGFEISDNGVLETVFNNDRDIEKANLPRQTFPSTYVANGYVDILRPSLIMEHARIHGNNVAAYKTEFVTEIDSPEDVDFLRFQIKTNEAVSERLWRETYA